jgi:hypothetical protein
MLAVPIVSVAVLDYASAVRLNILTVNILPDNAVFHIYLT